MYRSGSRSSSHRRDGLQKSRHDPIRLVKALRFSPSLSSAELFTDALDAGLDYLADDDIETTVDNLNYDNIRFTDDHSQIDFTAKYYLNDNLTLKLDLININDEPECYYWGNTSRLSQYDEYGRSATIGFTYKY